MNNHKQELEEIANSLLNQHGLKPEYSNRDFLNTLIIFQTALLDKVYDNQDYDNMDLDNRLKMVESCGLELKKLIHTYTGLNTHDVEHLLKT